MPDKQEYFNGSRPSASNSHWLPWLQKQLMIHDIKADTPEIPNIYAPKWDVCVEEVERFAITPETILVGHSLGAGFWVRYLSQNPNIFVDKVVLVAPWLNLDQEIDTDFFDFDIDPAITSHVNEFVVFGSDNDMESVRSTIALLQARLPMATYRTFHDYGHFTLRSMGTDAFPELLETILK